jgi:hypothetical protein
MECIKVIQKAVVVHLASIISFSASSILRICQRLEIVNVVQKQCADHVIPDVSCFHTLERAMQSAAMPSSLWSILFTWVALFVSRVALVLGAF